ncbi:MAG: DUF2723 domain-containing protein [Muribaculaceae bacterium]|nr:DUF2723 domain-containing protein [Muribaculaceae bacterium]
MYRIIPDYIRLKSQIASILVFMAAMAAYFLTVNFSPSFWDCPEYTTSALMLQVGHPPGNPVWMLLCRLVTMPFSSQFHPEILNMLSGLLMASAAFFLSRIIFHVVFWVEIKRTPTKNSPTLNELEYIPIAASVGGSLCFAFCDSVWFSAVETEVYAMSTALMAFSLWLMIKWAIVKDPRKRLRLLILTAYVTGLSLGVHQLNLLCIPAFALIYAFREYPGKGNAMRIVWITCASFVILALILVGMMNGTITWAAAIELFAVNSLGMPFFSGVYAYLAILFFAFVATIWLSYSHRRLAMAFALFSFIWLSGIFLVNSNIILAGCVSAVATFLLTFKSRLSNAQIAIPVWMLFFVIVGYSSFATILIRGYASPPMNEGAPTDIFALKRYISREQYGSKPLLYGPTPFSLPVAEERIVDGKATPDYSHYALIKKDPIYVKARPDARLHYRSGFLSHEDSAANNKILGGKGKDAYILSDYAFSRVTTPELNMWFPRITGSSPALIESYESWVGMNKENMTAVETSNTIDSLGNPNGKLDSEGNRVKPISWRPTYLQNLRMLMSYQIGYMYLRYLMWNFVGRQNDVSSTGEIDHGNFITGVSFIDNAMLGPLDKMPAGTPAEEKGDSKLFAIPFLLGIAGIVFLARCGRTGRKLLVIVGMLFFMTGIAIVIYLNQTPGEPRERDYSFLGSYMAFAIWIAFGFASISLYAFRFRNKLINFTSIWLPPIAVAVLMLAQNFQSHDRSNRSEVKDFAQHILWMHPNGIIFTQGDNFTFPLWYAQQIEHIGQKHQVIDISYLSTPEYVVNLMKQKHPALQFTAAPADIAYGAYAFTKIAPDADTVPVPLIDALKELYAHKSGAPVMRHSKVMIPGRTMEDTLTVDLRNFASANMIPFRKLMLLDIIATNLNRPDPKPLHFMTQIPKDFYSIVADATTPNSFADTYAPHLPKEVETPYFSFLPLSIHGFDTYILEPKHIDPVEADKRRRVRGASIRLAKYLFNKGDFPNAYLCAKISVLQNPYDLVHAGSYTVADSTFNEGLEYARLCIDMAYAICDSELALSATTTLYDMKKRSEGWKDYYTALSPAQRETVSNDTRRQIRIIPVIDSLLTKAQDAYLEIKTKEEIIKLLDEAYSREETNITSPVNDYCPKTY